MALLVGTQIGAGVLGLPAVIKNLGFFWGAMTILAAGLLLYLTALYTVDALYKINPNVHLAELVEMGLGRRWSILFALFLLIATWGALTAYLNGMSEALTFFIDGNKFVLGVILWLILSTIVVLGLKVSSEVESAAVFLMLLLFGLTILWALPFLKPYHINIERALPFIPKAFGVAVFAYFAHLVIPEVIKLERDRRRVVSAVGLGFAITATVYTLFSLATIGVMGENVPDIAVFGLAKVFGSLYAPIAYTIPLLTMLTSFIGIGTGMSDMLVEVIRRKSFALTLTLLPPIIFFISGLNFQGALVVGSLGLLMAGGIIPSLLSIKLRGPTPLNLSVLVIFLGVAGGEVISLVLQA